MTLVVDASAIVSALVDDGPVGSWTEAQMRAADRLAAPHVMPAEAGNVLRRAELAGDVPATCAGMAFHDLVDLPVELYPFEPLAERIWSLRGAITVYDAWYVSLAESLGVPLLTLDRRLANAPKVTCPVITPP